jgi:hypothetical protein
LHKPGHSGRDRGIAGGHPANDTGLTISILPPGKTRRDPGRPILKEIRSRVAQYRRLIFLFS